MSAKGWVVGLALIAMVVISGCRGATTAPSIDIAPTTEPAPGETDLASFAPIGGGGVPAIVTRVVDGDTIHATLGGVDEKVRIIGLDSPETDKPGTPVECFAREATAAAKRLLPNGTAIRLQADPTQDSRDRYGRLLAHVILPDGRLFAEVMIEGGFATHYVYDDVPSIYADRLAAAEDRAIAANAGLWSPTTCAGDGHTASAAP